MSYQDPEPVDPYGSPEAKGPAAWHAPASQDEKTWAMLCHLSALAGLVIPVGNIVAPLVVWLIKKDEMPLVDDQGKEALNFQLTIMFAMIAAGILTFLCIGALLMPVIMVLDLVFSIIACVKASNGEDYRYPLCIRLVK